MIKTVTSCLVLCEYRMRVGIVSLSTSSVSFIEVHAAQSKTIIQNRSHKPNAFSFVHDDVSFYKNEVG